MKHITLLVATIFLSVFSAAAQSADGGQTYDGRYFHYAVTRSGDTLRLSSRNMRADDKTKARFTGQSDIDNQTCMEIGTDKKGRLFSFQKFIFLEPDTRYRLQYQAVDFPAGRENLSFEVVFFDDARERAGKKSHVVTAGCNGTFDFVTTPDTRCAKVMLFVNEPRQTEARIDNILLTQLSEPHALRSATLLLERGNPFSKRKKIQSANLVAADFHEITMDVAWENPEGECEVEFEWQEDRKTITTRRCELRPVWGVNPCWNGISAEWKRPWSHSAEGISTQLEYKYGTSPSAGNARIVYLVAAPENAGRLVVSTCTSGANPPSILKLTVHARHSCKE